nr:MAG TPA: hypothetical protein [Caudoviricetes sp.]
MTCCHLVHLTTPFFKSLALPYEYYYKPFWVICQPFYNIFFIIFLTFCLINNLLYIIINSERGDIYVYCL